MRFQHVCCIPPEDFFLCHIVQVLTPDSWLKSSEIQLPYWSFHFESSKSLFTSLSLWCWTHLTILACLEYSKTPWKKRETPLYKFNSLPFKVQLTVAQAFVLHYNRIFQVALMQSDLKVFQACHCALGVTELRGIDLDILCTALCPMMELVSSIIPKRERPKKTQSCWKSDMLQYWLVVTLDCVVSLMQNLFYGCF